MSCEDTHRHMGSWLTLRRVFEVTLIMFCVTSKKSIDGVAGALELDMSSENAENSLLFFTPGVTPSLLLFIVF